jgi:RimJ/RimL family protein N-acetyltransferase
VFSHPLFSSSLGDGVELAMVEPWHTGEYLGALDGHREYLKAEIPAAHSILTADDAHHNLQNWAEGHAAGTRHLIGIWLDGTFVGVVQLFDVDAENRTAEMGVWLVPPAQGRGLITRTCRFVLDWAFRTLGLARVQWTAQPSNTRSIAVARRLGMTREGLLRSYWQVGGARRDCEVWSMLAEDWPAAPRD